MQPTHLLALALLFLSCSSPKKKDAPQVSSQPFQTTLPAPLALAPSAPDLSWKWLNPLPQGNPLNAVWVQGAIALAVGEAGTILRSTNTGKNWQTIASPTHKNLKAIWGSLQSVYAVGSDGTIVRSRDTGASWSLLESGVTQTLNAVWESPNGTIYLAGDKGLLLTATPEAPAWKKSNLPTEQDLFSVWGASDKELYLAGAKGTLLLSKDAGKSWSLQTPPTRYDLLSIWGASPEAVYLSGKQGLVLFSSDRGKSWQEQQSNTPSHLQGIWGASANELYSVGQFGQVIRTNDAGKTWQTQLLGDFRDHPRHLRGVFGTPSAVIAVGEEGLLLRSLDHGATWMPATSALRHGLQDGAIYGDTLFTVGDHGSIYTPDLNAGQVLAQASNASEALQDIFILGGGPLLVAGLRGAFLVSSDGRVWERRETSTSEHLFGVWGSSQDDVYVVGDKGLILSTTDLGKTWSTLASPSQARLLSIWGRSANELYACGEGVILRSFDRGQSWTSTRPELGSGPTKADGRLWSMTGRGQSEVFAVGNGGLFARSLDRGESWSFSLSDGGEDLLSIAVAGQALYAAGREGALYTSQDGARWEKIDSGTTQDISAVVHHKGALYLIGETGTILLANVSLN